MNDYATNTDWTRNKNSTSIIYQSADGSIIEITLDKFLAESPNNTAEMFMQLKKASDKLFQDEDNAGSRRAKMELPLFDWSDKYVSETLEEQFFNTHDDKNKRAYQERRKQMLTLVPEVLNRLTETQRRRFLLHKVKKLTTRKIAEIDGVTQQSVFESICGAEKKIEKFLLKYGQVKLKHPVKQED